MDMLRTFDFGDDAPALHVTWSGMGAALSQAGMGKTDFIFIPKAHVPAFIAALREWCGNG